MVPSVWHLLQPAVAEILGGALLGIMFGVWSPARGTPVIALVAMVAVGLWIDGQGQTASLFGPMTSWTDWGPYDGSIWYRLGPGPQRGMCCTCAASAAWPCRLQSSGSPSDDGSSWRWDWQPLSSRLSADWCSFHDLDGNPTGQPRNACT